MTDLFTFNFPSFDFWEVFWYLSAALLKIGAVGLLLFAIWGLGYLLLKQTKSKYFKKYVYWSEYIVIEQIYNSELFDSFRGLVGSIYDAISSIFRTLTSILNITFTSITAFIELPFSYVQRFFDRINDKVIQKTHIHKLAMEESRIRRRQDRAERKLLREREKLDFNKRLEGYKSTDALNKQSNHQDGIILTNEIKDE